MLVDLVLLDSSQQKLCAEEAGGDDSVKVELAAAAEVCDELQRRYKSIVDTLFLDGADPGPGRFLYEKKRAAFDTYSAIIENACTTAVVYLRTVPILLVLSSQESRNLRILQRTHNKQ